MPPPGEWIPPDLLRLEIGDAKGLQALGRVPGAAPLACGAAARHNGHRLIALKCDTPSLSILILNPHPYVSLNIF